MMFKKLTKPRRSAFQNLKPILQCKFFLVMHCLLMLLLILGGVKSAVDDVICGRVYFVQAGVNFLHCTARLKPSNFAPAITFLILPPPAPQFSSSLQSRATTILAALLPPAFLRLCLFPRHFIQAVYVFLSLVEHGSGRRRCHLPRHHRRLAQRRLPSRSFHRSPSTRIDDIV